MNMNNIEEFTNPEPKTFTRTLGIPWTGPAKGRQEALSQPSGKSLAPGAKPKLRWVWNCLKPKMTMGQIGELWRVIGIFWLGNEFIFFR